MNTKHPGEIAAGLAALSRDDRARIVKETRRMRSEALTGLFRSVGRGLARLTGVLTEPIVSAIQATGLPRRLALAWVWWREFRKVRAELETYSERELVADLRVSPSEILDIAGEAADERVAAFLRAHPEHRGAWQGQTRHETGAGWA